jgi:hypothetical protein
MTADSQSAPSVGVNDLRTYLTLQGWHMRDGGRSASLWENRDIPEPDRFDQMLLLPHIESAPDYGDRVSMAIEQLAQFQEESAEAILQKAALVHFDVAPMRAADDSAAIDDSIPLEAGYELYTAARKMIVAAAGATIRRQSHFGRSLPWAAREHSRSVRIGQTQRGSYIVPIISRARFGVDANRPPDQHLDVDVEESLFDRRVLTTFAGALGALQDLTDSDRVAHPSEIADAVSVGVSRELCVSLANALDAQEISSIDISFEWSPAATPPRNVPTKVSFSDASAQLLHDFGDSLKTLDRPREDVIFGMVTDLRYRTNDPEGRVGVETLIDRRPRAVWMNLTPEQYEVAKQCHGHSKVMVRGRLNIPKGGRAEMDVTYFGPDASLLDQGLRGVETPSGLAQP